MQNNFKNFFLLIALFFFSSVFLVGAMEGDDYKIEHDVLSSGGGYGDSENYIARDTIGEAVIGVSAGGNYDTYDGFWSGTLSSILLELDSAVVDLGSIAPNSPVMGQTSITVNTDAWGGYDLLIKKNNQLTHTDTTTTISDYSCAIDSPCVWSGTGLGFSVVLGTNVEPKWGVDPNYAYASIPNSDTVFHQKTGFKAGDDLTTVRYKLDVPSTQRSGNYSNVITFTAMEKL